MNESKDEEQKVNIYKANSIQQIERVKAFEINNLLWGTKEIPKTRGWLGATEDVILLIMRCEEVEPIRTFYNINDEVYMDSAMEAFIQIVPQGMDRVGIPYVNFEFNANGALLVGVGIGRNKDRIRLSPEVIRTIDISVKEEDSFWEVELKIPLKLFMTAYQNEELSIRDEFYGNFYKIVGGNEAHFASCFRIESDEVNFHVPQYFRKLNMIL